MANGIIAVVKLPTTLNVKLPTTLNSQQPDNPISLKNVPLNQEYLSQLLDVDSSSLANGYTLVYSAIEQKFVTQPITITVPSIDAGEF